MDNNPSYKDMNPDSKDLTSQNDYEDIVVQSSTTDMTRNPAYAPL